MEKASNNNNNNSTKLSNMLQRALSIGHSTTSFSPARELYHYRTTSTARRSFFFSSPITPLIPSAARGRRRTKNDVGFAEPTSPKVSCIGQIKHGKSKCPEKKNRAGPKNLKTGWSLLSSSVVKEEGNKGSFTKLKRLFSTRKSNSTAAAEHSAAAVEAVVAPSFGKMKRYATTREAIGHPVAAVEAEQVVVAAPSLGKMKKFLSSREAFDGFDWTVGSNHGVSLEVEDLSLCPKQKSEVNLWKRRSMDRPKPLQVKATY